MSSEWISIPASEFCLSVRDGTHDSPKEVLSGGKNLVTSRHIKGGLLDLSTSYKISGSDYEEINKRSKVDQWDILFSMIGTVGEVLLVKEPPDFAIKNVGLFKSKDETTGKWLYYYLQSPNAKEEIYMSMRGSTQQYIPLGALRSFPIRHPQSTGEMREITNILATLDDKIELNRKTNETLEAMAKALFKSWFVDFDPVRAKAEGRPTGLPAEISDLFPDSFEDSELGEIPSGWEVTSSDNFCRSVRDGTHDSPKPVSKGGHPLVTSKHIKGRILDLSSTYKISTEDFDNVNKRSLVEKGDVLISMIGTLGEILYVDEDPKFAIKNVGLFKSRSEGSGQWWYLFLQSQDVGNFLRISAQGSTQQYLSLRTLRSIPVTIPTENILRYFGRVSGDIFRRKLVARRDIEILGQIRNSLLPKLISGEIRIPDAEKILEEVDI